MPVCLALYSGVVGWGCLPHFRRMCVLVAGVCRAPTVGSVAFAGCGVWRGGVGAGLLAA